MTFSFDHGSHQMIPDFGSPQVSKPAEPQGLAATDCPRLTEFQWWPLC